MSTESCQCIRIVYTPTSTGVEITTELSVTGILNGRNYYDFLLAEEISNLYYSIYWDGETWIFKDENEIIDSFTTLTNCPFAELGEVGIFDEFSILPCVVTTPEEVQCYKLEVWNKQCEYSKCVLEYVNNLIFGVEVCKLQESLKEQRRVLEILNCYDPRDIPNNTVIYNTIPYGTIKKLLYK